MTHSQFPLKAVATSACCVLPTFRRGPTQQPSFHCYRSRPDNKPKRRFEFHQCWVKQKLQHLLFDCFVLMRMYALLSVYFMQGLFYKDNRWSAYCGGSCWVTRDAGLLMEVQWCHCDRDVFHKLICYSKQLYSVWNGKVKFSSELWRTYESF